MLVDPDVTRCELDELERVYSIELQRLTLFRFGDLWRAYGRALPYTRLVRVDEVSCDGETCCEYMAWVGCEVASLDRHSGEWRRRYERRTVILAGAREVWWVNADAAWRRAATGRAPHVDIAVRRKRVHDLPPDCAPVLFSDWHRWEAVP